MNTTKECTACIESVNVQAYKIPTETPEADGTYRWTHTVLVVTEIKSGDTIGMGYTYANLATAYLIKDALAKTIKDMNAFDLPAIWNKMVWSIRNVGRDGIASMAISAIDTALWDLKAKLLDLPLVSLWGGMKNKVEVYGSGGFTNYNDKELEQQLDLWRSFGITKIKIKIGSNPEQDIQRVIKIKNYLRNECDVFVDANGAFDKKEALLYAHEFAHLGVSWFEEPVSSDHISSLALLTQQAPPPIHIAAGEYGYDLFYFKRMLESQAVDILQADATRCGGFTELFKVIDLSTAFAVPLSTHCAPYLHLHAACASNIIHSEYFFDHFRIEQELFDGPQNPEQGFLSPDLSIPGLGMVFKKKDAEKYIVR